jgi:hypothetical protein
VLLQVMPFPWDIGNRRLPRAQLDSSHFPDGRVRLLGFRRVDFGTHGFLLETLFEEGGFGEFGEFLTGSSSDCTRLEGNDR